LISHLNLNRFEKEEVPNDLNNQLHDLWAGLLNKLEADKLIETQNNCVIDSSKYAVVQEIREDLESSYDCQSSATNSYSLKPSDSSNKSRVNKFNAVLFKVGEAKSKENSLPSFNFESVSDPLTISFKGLNLFLKSNHQKLLTNVSGVVKHHKITALMGPSGAGTVINDLKYAATKVFTLLQVRQHY